MWNFVFFARSQITDACLFICFFVCFFKDDRIDPVVLECREKAHSNEIKSSSAISKLAKIWRAPRPPPTHTFSSKSPDQNYEIAILFSLVENLTIMSLGTTSSPTVTGRGAASNKI